jgi:hypothetical protein
MNEAAFVGRFGPLMQHVLKLPDVPSQTIKVYPVLVEQAFRGVDAGSTIYVHTWEALEPSPTGRQYLVYGSFNFIVRDVVSPASLESLIPIEQAETHLAFLTSSESRLETTGRVFGVLQQGSPFDTSDRRPLAGILLHVHVGDFLTETTSDANGRFDVGGLPEGFFKIEPELPSQLTTAHFGGGTVRAGGCVPTTVLVQWNGIIRGRITRFDQSPVRGPVDLLSVQQPRSGSGRRNDAFERGTLADVRRQWAIRVHRGAAGRLRGGNQSPTPTLTRAPVRAYVLSRRDRARRRNGGPCFGRDSA